MKRIRSAFLPGVLAALLFFSGCAPAARPPTPPPPPGMERVLLEKLRENAGTVRSLRGIAKVRVTSGGKSVSGNQVLFAREPDRFRAEVLSPFGQPLLLAATDGSELTVLVPGEGRVYRGEASYRNLQRFTRLPLELRDLVSLLLYEVPLLPEGEAAVTADPEGYRLTLAGAGGMRQELLFDPRLRLIRSAWFRGGDLLVQADYGDFSETGPVFPRALSLRVPPEESEATLTFSELDLNPEIPEARFTLEAPAGYSVEPLP